MKAPGAVLRKTLALAGGVAAVLLVAGLSRVPYTAHDDPDALLRLSWRIQGNAVEACRALGTEEMEELPVHMRNPDACQRRGRSYRLRVWTDGRILVDRVVKPSGARGDRPVYVFDEAPLSPGRHELRVVFEPLAQPGEAGAADTSERTEPVESAGEALRFRDTVEADAGQVVLVTLESDGGGRQRIVVRTSLP